MQGDDKVTQVNTLCFSLQASRLYFFRLPVSFALAAKRRLHRISRSTNLFLTLTTLAWRSSRIARNPIQRSWTVSKMIHCLHANVSRLVRKCAPFAVIALSDVPHQSHHIHFHIHKPKVYVLTKESKEKETNIQINLFVRRIMTPTNSWTILAMIGFKIGVFQLSCGILFRHTDRCQQALKRLPCTTSKPFLLPSPQTSNEPICKVQGKFTPTWN